MDVHVFSSFSNRQMFLPERQITEEKAKPRLRTRSAGGNQTVVSVSQGKMLVAASIVRRR